MLMMSSEQRGSAIKRQLGHQWGTLPDCGLCPLLGGRDQHCHQTGIIAKLVHCHQRWGTATNFTPPRPTRSRGAIDTAALGAEEPNAAADAPEVLLSVAGEERPRIHELAHSPNSHVGHAAGCRQPRGVIGLGSGADA